LIGDGPIQGFANSSGSVQEFVGGSVMASISVQCDNHFVVRYVDDIGGGPKGVVQVKREKAQISALAAAQGNLCMSGGMLLCRKSMR
jgi:hypothetical protein